MKKNFIGNTYGYLTVKQLHEVRNQRSFYLCVCKCGNEVVKRSDLIKSNSSCNSCKAEKQRKRMIKHNETHTKLYDEWRGIKARCYNPNTKCYNAYGGRGIMMCEQWKQSYENFRDFVTKLPDYGKEGYSLDRINVDGNYEPNNVRWASAKTQATNKRQTVYITFKGKTLSLKEWSKELGIKYSTLCNRRKMGWNDKRILTESVHNHL